MDASYDVGLEIHTGKTKILNKCEESGSVMCSGRSIQIVDSTMYLGRLFSFNQTHDTELRNRVGKAWARFALFEAPRAS